MRKLTLTIILATTLIFVGCTNKNGNQKVSNTDSTQVDSTLNSDELANTVDSVIAVDSIK